jgi:heat-inducible transcriptional repressor
LSFPELNYSSATIRNDMADLEDLDLITKTHTSSGRVPTEAGYRVYVQDIINNREYKESDVNPVFDEIFSRDLISREQAVKESMSIVTKLTNYASVVLGGAAYNSKIKKLQFVSLNNKFAVILMVTDQGYVESKKIVIPEDIRISDIERVISLLNDILHNCSISEIDTVLKEKLQENEILVSFDYYDELMSVFIRAFSDMAKDKYYMAGQSRLFSQPEFANVDKAQSLLKAIEKRDIFKVVNLSDEGITVKIGQENQIKAMEDCTVITVPYENDVGDKGAIAVIGPTRMDYQRVIPLLEYIAQNLKKM